MPWTIRLKSASEDGRYYGRINAPGPQYGADGATGFGYHLTRCVARDIRNESAERDGIAQLRMKPHDGATIEQATRMEHEKQFQRGAALFNAREFFLAHEVWEEIWLAEAEPEKTFVQGLVQLAAAFHHYTRGNWPGAQSLLASAAVKLQRYSPAHRGIAVAELRAGIVAWARKLGDGEDPGLKELPRLTSA